MLAQIPHVLLAAHAPTIMGVETNAMQFYPDASAPEAAVHPGLYRRAGGRVDLTTVTGPASAIASTRSNAACASRSRASSGARDRPPRAAVAQSPVPLYYPNSLLSGNPRFRESESGRVRLGGVQDVLESRVGRRRAWF